VYSNPRSLRQLLHVAHPSLLPGLYLELQGKEKSRRQAIQARFDTAACDLGYKPLSVYAAPALASRLHLLDFRMTDRDSLETSIQIFTMGQPTVEERNEAHAHGARFYLVTEGGAAPSVAEAAGLLAAPNPMLPSTMEQLLCQCRQFHVVCHVQYGTQHAKTLAYGALSGISPL
jgi:hypothetical protein